MKAIYKTYDPAGTAIIFRSIKAASDGMGLSFDDRKKIAFPGAHVVSTGDTIITYMD